MSSGLDSSLPALVSRSKLRLIHLYSILKVDCSPAEW
jgi:hypothetical protein